MPQDRRSFLATLGGVAAGLTSVRALSAADLFVERRTKLSRIGIQLYTLRRQAQADLAGTLAALAKIGYKEIELAGYYNHPAMDVRTLLDQNGLTSPSGHIAIEAIETNPSQTFADAKAVGHQWITVPSLPRGPKTTADDWKAVANRFNKAAAACKAAGFRFAFHNHNDIVRKTGDVLPIEILMKETDPSLVSYQMDIYWAVNGGADPLTLLATYPDRFKMFHVKDSTAAPELRMADVGAGTIDFRTIFAKAKGIEHYFVERDDAPDPLASAAASFKYLSNLTF
jgi:sugar phosphate isomerase/epimerase